MVEVDEARQRRVVAELGVACQMWVMAEVGFFCVNFDLKFFFFWWVIFWIRILLLVCFDFGMDFFCGFMVVELGVAVVVVEGGGVFIMGHMLVHGGEGGGLPW